jgi:hypothetical protein
MSNKDNHSDLLVELSAEEQELEAGGYGGYYPYGGYDRGFYGGYFGGGFYGRGFY